MLQALDAGQFQHQPFCPLMIVGMEVRMYKKGDRVIVEGFNQRSAILTVWEIKKHGLVLCTDAAFQLSVVTGQEPVTVGFPMADVKGLASKSQISN